MKSDRDYSSVAKAISEQVRLGCDRKRTQELQAWRVAARGECLGSSLTFSANCSLRSRDDRPGVLDRRAEGTVLGRAFDLPYPEICDELQVERTRKLPSCRGALCSSDTIPALLITGDLDPIGTLLDQDEVAQWLWDVLGSRAAVSTITLVNGTRSDLSFLGLADSLARFLESVESFDTRLFLPPVFTD